MRGHTDRGVRCRQRGGRDGGCDRTVVRWPVYLLFELLDLLLLLFQPCFELSRLLLR
jgi:hypothetical protein